MLHPAEQVYRTDPDREGPFAVLPGLREFFMHDREATAFGAEELANRLRPYVGRSPAEHEVAWALETLRDEDGELLA